MKYTVYQITNNINGKVYIGKHQTKDLKDGYMGSGKLVKRAQKKHGIENFTKELLHIFDTEDEMNAKEKELVTEEFIARSDTYNLCPGGQGGFGHIRMDPVFHSRCAALGGAAGKGKPINNSHLMKPETKAKSIHTRKKNIADGILPPPFLGKTHKDSTKQKMRAAKVGKYAGDSNSQHGTKWITDGSNSIKIKSTDTLPDGWRWGRVLKN